MQRLILMLLLSTSSVNPELLPVMVEFYSGQVLR